MKTPLPQVDLTITISVILALCAIISPVLVTIFNNRSQYKIRKLEIESRQKYEITEQYLKAVSKYISMDSLANFKEYNEARGLIYIYIPKRSQKYVDKLDRVIVSKNFQEAQNLFPEICKELAKTFYN